MTAPDLTDAIRDEYRRLSAQVVEYLTGQGWTVARQSFWGGEVVDSARRLHLQWEIDRNKSPFGSWFVVWDERNETDTRLQAQVSSAQQAVDYLVVAAILPESMASWASRLDEVAR